MDNVGFLWIVEKVGDCPCAAIGEMGFVDNVDNVYLKIIRYHIYCIDIQWCNFKLLQAANVCGQATLSTTRPRQKAALWFVDNVDHALANCPQCPHSAP